MTLDNVCNIPVKHDIGAVLVLRDQSFWVIDFLGDTFDDAFFVDMSHVTAPDNCLDQRARKGKLIG